MDTSVSTPPPSDAFFRLVGSPLRFRLFLMKKLPAAFFAGLRLEKADAAECTVGLRYSWATQNPFRSLYFACQAMAAEMSTGVLAMAHLYGRRPGVSMLVTGMEAQFHKKATGRIRFKCTEGEAIGEAVARAVSSGEGVTVRAASRGWNERGELVAEFWFTWSFKRKGI
ncbi:MAG TPA: DUF4442 domain-containing protein [Chitinophagaceae bacterium]|jgi:hypothetical protein|nr:DUF4442 domain-containing protein [Chitinophagaceae bacterium]